MGDKRSYMRVFFLFFSLFVFFGCDGAKPEQSNTKRIVQPSDTSRYFYAIGYGNTQKEAKNDALSTISEKISLKLSSEFSSSVKSIKENSGERVFDESTNNIYSKTKEIEYEDVKVKQSYFQNGKWIALVEVDKNKLVSTYAKKLDKTDNKIQTQWDIYQKSGDFEKLKYSVNIKKYIKEADKTITLIDAINSDFDTRKYLRKYERYKDEIQKAESKMVFRVVGDKNSKPLVSLVKTSLSEKNISCSDDISVPTIKITTKAQKRRYNVENERFAKLTFALRDTKIEVRNKQNRVVSTVVYKTKSASSKGFEDAIARVDKYKKMIKQTGIVVFLTGN